MPLPGPAQMRRRNQRLGTTLKGKYTLERVLGAGGMATVYLGVHRNGYRVAVKILHPEISIDEHHAARFVREGYIANAIAHRGGVRVLDDDVAEDGARFLVMELLDGESLEARRRRSGGSLPPRDVLALGHALLDVLEAAHAKGIIHRDVKPENLFLTVEGHLKVLDFGLARMEAPPATAAQAPTLGGRAMGTPAFMPPEQALGRRNGIDHRTDIWAAGATLFTLLTGELVHEAETSEEIVVLAATRPARSLAAACPDAPAPLVDLVDRALRFDREQRWPTARAMQQAIAEAYEALYGEPIERASLEPSPSQLMLPPDTSDPSGDGAAQPGGSHQAATTVPVSTPCETSPELASSLSEPAASEPLATLSAAPGPAAEPEAPPPAPPVRAPRTGARAAALAAGLAAVIGAAALVADRRPSALEAAGPAHSQAAPRACASNEDCATPHEVCGRALRCIPRKGCASNAECVAAAGGKPALCHKEEGRCAPLETEGCRVLAEQGDLTNDATLWVGALFPMTGPESFGRASVDAIDLARRDFAETSSGLPAIRPGGPPRPIGVVACDDAVDPERAALHLLDEVGVPAVLGFARSKEVLDLADALFIPRGVLALASNTASMLATIPRAQGGPRLVFRTTISNRMVGPPTSAFVSQRLEPELRSLLGLRGEDPIRVALARPANPSGLGVSESVVATLRVNGKTVAQNGRDFLQISTPDGMHGDPGAATRDATAEVIAFRPHILISAAGSPAIVRAVEEGWPAHERYRPRYVLTGVPLEEWPELVSARPELGTRVFAVDVVSSTEARAKFVLRHNEVFPHKVTSATATSAPYDAFYLLAYAAAALGDQPITGAALARAIERTLPPGARIDVGPAGIYPAFHALAEGKSVDLEGTVTSLDFDLSTGDATADFAIYCFTERGGGLEMVESGLVHAGRPGAFEGTMRCP